MKQKGFLALLVSMIMILTLPAYAATEKGNYDLVAPYYQKWCAAQFVDTSKSGDILLSVSSSPKATIELFDSLSWFCNATGFVGIKVSGCEAVDIGEKFYKYVGKNMKVMVKLTDTKADTFVWEGELQDGDLIHLGNDHPDGYNIYLKTTGPLGGYPFVKMMVLNNLDLE